jgi:hypothetical protein
MYHLELRQFPHVARIFNLERAELETRFVRPWLAGTVIDYDDRRWAPDKTRLKVLEGPRLRPDELGLGRGWANAGRNATDVTDAILAEARRGAEARPEVEALKAAITEVAGSPIAFQDTVALAAAAHPAWRASEQLALAEQAVWEMLHQGRLAMTAGGAAIPRERWQPVVLSWETWLGSGDAEVRLHTPTTR